MWRDDLYIAVLEEFTDPTFGHDFLDRKDVREGFSILRPHEENKRHQAYYQKNKEKVLSKHKAWTQANPGKQAEYSKRFREKQHANHDR